jgi:hypothetical protein
VLWLRGSCICAGELFCEFCLGCFGGEDHVWFEDQWRVSFWCDE